jgi:hypothetical protein
MKYQDTPADPREYLPPMERRCGRLGDHDPHEWRGEAQYVGGWYDWTPRHRQTYRCPGTTVVEGGHDGHPRATRR